MKPGFRAWLEGRMPRAVAASRAASVARLERDYGELDAIYAADGFANLISDLTYSRAHSRAGKPNPSRVSIAGDIYSGLATLKSSLSLYQQFLSADGLITTADPEEGVAEISPAEVAANTFGLERDLQTVLRRHIDQLECGLKVIDGGAERRVPSGFIDITAEDAAGAIVVIELKAGRAGRDAIGQILAYMGDVSDEEGGSAVRGIIVASDFDHRARSAARLVPTLQLRCYSITFSFSDGHDEDRRLPYPSGEGD